MPYLVPSVTSPFTCLDIGSGAGFPTIPVAALRPEAIFVLWESNAKKAAFLRKATVLLGLNHCVVTHGWFEAKYSTVIPEFVLSRAVARADKLISLIGPLLAQGACLLYQGNQRFENPSVIQQQIFDEFDRRKLRRSRLSIVSMKPPEPNSST